MVKGPYDFKHFKDLGNGKIIEVFEEGSLDIQLNASKDFQKFMAKEGAYLYKGYDHGVDMYTDVWKNGLGVAEKKAFDEKKNIIWEEKKKFMHQEEMWYMIMEKKVALYQDKKVWAALRDEFHPPQWSYKACSFDDLEAAKKYVQFARDEEGGHFNWPQTIPVYWKKGPLTRHDIEVLPAFSEEEL